jgi:hypothetical protein
METFIFARRVYVKTCNEVMLNNGSGHITWTLTKMVYSLIISYTKFFKLDGLSTHIFVEDQNLS